jgi:hypothetical protein
MIKNIFLCCHLLLAVGYATALPQEHNKPQPTQSSQAQDQTGCCCFKKDLQWDCSGTKPGTQVTKAQCKKDAEDLGLAREGMDWKWTPGPCKDTKSGESSQKTK